MARGRRGRLLLIDAHSLLYLAFFALPPMSTSGGEVTNAVYGFTAMVTRSSRTDTMTPGAEPVRQSYEIEPLQMSDYKALRGDSSDNVPGVRGVGEKTAIRLVQQFGSIEALLERQEELPDGRIKAN